MWVKDDATAYMNLDNVVALGLAEESGTWFVDAYLDDTVVLGRLAGSWPSSADALEAVRELTAGVDPSTYGD